MDVEVKVKIKVGKGKTVEIDHGEAKELYEKLGEVFGKEERLVPYYPYLPTPRWEWPYDTRWYSTAGTTITTYANTAS